MAHRNKWIPLIAGLGFLFLFGSSPAVGEAPLRIGVSGGWGSSRLVEMITAQPGLEAVEISRITPAALEGCHVLVVTQRTSGLPITRAAPLLKSWVEGGKGILFLHGAVGHRSHIPLFDAVGAGADVYENEPMIPAGEHPITEGVEKTGFLSSSRYNFVSLRLGPSGEAVLGTDRGAVSVAAGSVGNGRVVLHGIGAGAAGEFDHHNPVPPEEMVSFREPEGAEFRVLLNAVQWLGFRAGATEETP